MQPGFGVQSASQERHDTGDDKQSKNQREADEERFPLGAWLPPQGQVPKQNGCI